MTPAAAWRDERPHVASVIDEAELDLRAELDERDDVEVLALLRFALILDRGALLLACAGAPAPELIARMGDRRVELARGLRAVANVIDPQE